MDPQLNEVSQVFARFKAAFTRNDFNTCNNLLSQLKVLLIKFPSLPPTFQKTPNAIQELTIARDIYEHAVVLSMKLEDQDAFERDFFQLKPYYTDTWIHKGLTCSLWAIQHLAMAASYCKKDLAGGSSVSKQLVEQMVMPLSSITLDLGACSINDDTTLKEVHIHLTCPNHLNGVIPPSPQEYPILGLNLLRLLVQNRIAEFHTELELLPASALENPCIKHAVELEQSFMEGAYSRVLSARQTVPHDTYVYFMDLLAKTVRDEIAGCSEKAYDYLSISNAKKILMFSSDQELSQYITEEHPEWEIKNGCLHFQKARESQPCKEIPSLQLINQTLNYAKELERIV